MNLDLNNKHALVCGASLGIGEAISYSLANEGVKLTLLARSKDKLQIVKSNLKGNDHQILCLDINDHKKLKEEIIKIQSVHPIDILINNTSGPKAGAILDASTEELISSFNQHIISAKTLNDLVIPHMKNIGFGRIINIISTSVKCPIPNLGVSNTIRAAMASYSKTLSNEVAPFGITINNILPGYTKTERLKSLIKYKAEMKKISYEEEEQNWINEVPAKRFATPNELADFCTFLSSPLASYITGTSIAIDGGKTPTLS